MRYKEDEKSSDFPLPHHNQQYLLIKMALNATMRAVLWAGIPFQMNVTSIPMPTIQSPTDTIVKITTAGICGTDLHVYHGVYGSADVPYTIGHEGVGVVVEVGSAVSNFQVGDRVIIPDSVDDKGLLEVNRVSYGLGSEYGDAGGLQGNISWSQLPMLSRFLI